MSEWSSSVVSDSLRPDGLYSTMLLHPWDFPGKGTGVGCHFLLRYTHYYWANSSISAWSQATPHPGPAALEGLSLSFFTAPLSSCQVILLVLHTYPSTQTSPSTHQGRQEIVGVKGAGSRASLQGFDPSSILAVWQRQYEHLHPRVAERTEMISDTANASDSA